jgi:ferredoxin/flavodoxin
MKTIIYFFTGTGNSLAAAQTLCAELGECELMPIAPLMKTGDDIVPDAERVGIVCPVYDMGLPSIVAEFAHRLKPDDIAYLFAVLTMGGIGDSALKQLDGILREKHRRLNAAFTLQMPGNFVPLYNPPGGERKERILGAAGEKIQKIARAIRNGEQNPPGIAPLSSLLKVFLYPPFIRRVHGYDEKFTADDRCTSCGICEKVCPVENIELMEGRPVWLHRCELCMACLHLCPTRAIQWGKKTENRDRYRHPDLTVSDMERQQTGK